MTYNLDIRVILPVISILSFGSLEVYIIRRIFKIKSKKTFLEYLVDGLILGSLTLICPMIMFGLLTYYFPYIEIISSLMGIYCYSYFACGILFFLYFVYIFIKNKLPNYLLQEKEKFRPSVNKLFIIVVILMLVAYTFQSIIYPIRGWDALHFYLPNSFRIFATGELGKINELNFLPQFKPPLNVMLYAYTFFITLSEMIQLVPMMFFYGTVYFCYKIMKLEGFNDRNSIMGMIALLATPLVYFLIYEYQYYQEIFIMFFTTASYYYYKLFLLSDSNKDQIYAVLMTSLSFGGCILSKISGFLLPLVIFVSMPSDKLGKVLRSLIVIGLLAQILRKSIFETYIGTVILITLLGISSLYFILRMNSLAFSYKRWFFIVIVFSFPITVGAIWIKHIFSITGVEQYLRGVYWEPNAANIQFSWPGIELPISETYLENAHTATFLTSSFSIFIALMFASTWFLFKIIGLVKMFNQKKYDLILWLVLFYMVWQGFFSKGSIRYLSPILVPLSIIFVMGFQHVIDFFNKQDNRNRDGFIAYLFLISTAYLSLYPAIPFEAITETNFHLRWYIAHTHLFSLLGSALLFTSLVILLIWQEKKLKLSYSKIFTHRFNIRKVSAIFLIFIAGVVPMIAQTALLVYYRFDINKFHGNYAYFSRYEYQELKDSINAIGAPDTETVLSINTPGLEYYVSQPVLDLFLIRFIKDSGLADINIPLETENITRLFDFFYDLNITMFVSQNSGNVYYPSFLSRYYNEYYLFRFLLNNKLFTQQFVNNEYILYTMDSYNFNEPYVGPVDFFIQGYDTHDTSSVYAYNHHGINVSGQSVSLRTIFDFTAIPTTQSFNVTFSTEYSSFNNRTKKFVSNTFQMVKPTEARFNYFTLLNIEQYSHTIHSVVITINYKNSKTNIEEVMQYKVTTLSSEGFTIYKGLSNYWFSHNINGFIIEQIKKTEKI